MKWAVAILVSLLVVIAAISLKVKNVPAPSRQQVAEWKLYRNEKYRFTLRVPENLITVVQDDGTTLSDFLFIDREVLKTVEKHSLFKENPLVVALNQNIGGLQLYRNTSPLASALANGNESDIKSYLSRPAGAPHGEVEVVLKDFSRRVTDSGRTMYVYTRELQTDPVIEDVGALWISSGAMYTLENLSRGNLLPTQTLFAVASSFTETVDSTVPVDEQRIYRNDKYGFALSFPKSWDGYKATVHEYGSSGTYYGDVCFWFEKPHQPYCVLQISILTRDQWTSLKRRYPAIAEPERENNRFLFDFEDMTGASSSRNIACVQLDDFQCDRKKETPSILQTFKFTN